MAGRSPNSQLPIVQSVDRAALVHEQSPDVLRTAAGDKRLTEDLALTLLQRRDLPAAAIEVMAKNGAVMKHRKVINALVVHPHPPPPLSFSLIPPLFPFLLIHLPLFPPFFAPL